ncbi:fimbrial protein [Aeromonas hydrophila]|uniref:fimbrial protein n=1 Tax=Aeromonas hydrophila TaxID=644 RepID=UPI001C5AC51C|nr:fimbrial protein [Aeromonas hydrophila]MBW3812448.1 fimbrial protein [Aeromonas hydrophila]
MRTKYIAAAITLSMAGISISANAAQINFKGKVTAQTCSIENGKDIEFILPTVGIDDVKDIDAHNGVTTVSLPVQCPGDNANGTVHMALMPNVGSTEGKLLKNIDISNEAAHGVGIVVLDNRNKALDFESGAVYLDAPLKEGNARIKLSAAYAKDTTEEKVTPGAVSAVLPFVLTYE